MNKNNFLQLNTPQSAHRLNVISLLLNHEEDFLEFLFGHKSYQLRISGNKLIKESKRYNRKDQLLIKAALDIWNGSGNLEFSECLKSWDYAYWIKFIRAITCLIEIHDELIDALLKDDHNHV